MLAQWFRQVWTNRRQRSRRPDDEFVQLRLRRLDDRRVFTVASVTLGAASGTSNEGSAYTLPTSTYKDSGTASGPHTVTVDWGDGSNGTLTDTEPASVGANGTITSAQHTYNDNGVFTVTVTVTGADATFATDTLQVTVSNVNPTANAGADVRVAFQGSVQLSGSGTKPAGVSDTLTYDWDLDGDGTFGEANTAFGSEVGQTPTFDASTLLAGVSRNLTLRVRDEDGGSATDTLQLTVNRPPTVSTTGTALAYSEGDGAVIVDSALQASDADVSNLLNGAVVTIGNYVAGEDFLRFTNQNGISGVFANGTLTLSGTTTETNYRTALRSIRYENTSDTPDTTTRSVSFQVSDDLNASTAATRSITVAAVNDAPTVTTTAGTTTYTEGGASVAVDPTLTVADVDSTNLKSAIVQITTGFDTTQDVLTFTASANVSGSYAAGTGILTLSGSATLAEYQTVLRSVKYANTSNNPSTSRVISFTVTDDETPGVTSTAATRNLSITPVNDAPSVTTTAGTVSYTEGNAAIVIDGGLTVADVDSTNLKSATVQITTGFDSTQDVLTFTASANVSGSYAAGTGILTLSGSATLAEYQTVLRSIKYSNTSNDPSTSRVISFTVTDDETPGLDSTAATRNLSITPVNDAPTVTTTAGTTTYTEGAAAVTVDSTLTVADADSTNLKSATVRITTGFSSSQDVLTFTASANVSGSYAAGTGILTLTGSATAAEYQTVLRSVKYSNTSDNPTTSRVISFTVTDDETPALTSTAATRNLSITLVNDAPTVTTSAGSASYTEGNAATVIDSGITVADVDSTNLSGASVSITTGFNASQDLLVFVTIGSISGGYNASTGVLTLSGTATVAQYQTALQSVKYHNSSDNPTTSRTISFTVTDSNASPQTSAAATRNLTITPVNDAPTVTTSAGSASYTEGGAAAAVDPTITVVDDSALLKGARVQITTGFNASQDVLTFTASANVSGSYAAGTGILTLTGSATIAEYQTVLRSVKYANSNDNPSTSRVISFTVTDDETPALTSTAATRNLTITLVNDPPTVTTSAGTVSFTENGSALVVDSGLTIADPDSTQMRSATISISQNFVSAEDVLAFTAGNGITGSYNASTGVLTLSGTTTLANYVTALRSVTYSNTSDNPSTATRTISFVVQDSSSVSSTAATRDVTITATNDAPTVTLSGNSPSYTENGAAVAVDPNLTVADVDDAFLLSAEVRISNNFNASQDVLQFTAAGTIVGSYNTATGILTFSGIGTKAEYQATLRSVTYRNTSDDPTTAARTITFIVSDATTNSNPASKTLTVVAVNDPPVVVLTPGSTSYTENGAAILVDGGITINDLDDTTLTGAQVAVSNNFLSSQDVLTFTASGGITGSYNSSTGVLTLTGSATLAAYETVLNTVRYRNTSDNPSTLTRSITFTVNDGTTNSSPATRNVTITAANDPPVVNVPPTQTTGSRQPIVLSTANGNAISISDVDVNNGTIRVTLSVTPAVLAGTLTLARTTGLTFITGDGTNDAFMDFTGTLANVNAALDGLQFTPRPKFNLPAQISITVDDQGNTPAPALSGTGVVVISVSPTNDPPVNTVPGTQNINEDTPLVFGPGNGNAISVDDEDADPDPVQVKLSVGRGTLTLSGLAGLTIVAGANGTNTVTFQGTLADVNAALNGLTYTPQFDDSGVVQLSIETDDLGHSGTGGAKRDTDTITINIAPVNDAPTVTVSPGGASYTEGNPGVPVDPTLIVNDVDSLTLSSARVSIVGGLNNGQDVLEFTNTLLISGGYNATTGVLTLTGIATVAQYQSALRSITYRNTSNNPTTAPRSVEFVVNDGSLDSIARTQTVAVTAINNPPTIGAVADVLMAQNASSGPFAFTVGDVDNPASSLVVSAASSDLGVLPAAALVVGGSGANRTITINSINASGTVVVTLTVNDGNGGTASSTFRVVVNDPPAVTTPPDLTVDEDTPNVVNPVTIGDTETPPANLTVALQSSNPALIANDGNSLFFTRGPGGLLSIHTVLAANVSGSSVITITVTDPLGQTATTSYRVTVSPVNDRPSVNPLDLQTREDTAVVGTLTGSDDDPDFTQTLTYALATLPTNGTIVGFNATTGQFTYLPDANFSGSDTFTVVVTDDASAGANGPLTSAPQTVRIVVTPVADAPQLTGGGGITGDEGTPFFPNWDVQLADTDGSEQITSVVISNVPAAVALVGTNGVEYANTIVGNLKTYTMSLAQFNNVEVRARDNIIGSIRLTAISTETTAANGSPDRTATASIDVPMTIRNLPPQILYLAGTPVNSDATTTLFVDIDDAPSDTYTVVITWGTSTIGFLQQTVLNHRGPGFVQLTQPFTFIVAPNPANPSAPIEIQVRVTDKDGGVATESIVVPVAGTGIATPTLQIAPPVFTQIITTSYVQQQQGDNRNWVEPPPPQAQMGRVIVERRSTGQRQILLRVVSSRGSESAIAHTLPASVLVDLPAFLRKLPDGHYRLYLAENEFTPPRMLVDVMVFRGRAVSPGDMQADRPPTQEISDSRAANSGGVVDVAAKPSSSPSVPSNVVFGSTSNSATGPALGAPSAAADAPPTTERNRP
jgi:hypothetical protein